MRFSKQLITTALCSTLASVHAFAPRVSHPTAPALKSAVTGDNNRKPSFQNDGPFSFMQPSLENMGIQEGKSIVNGVFTAPVSNDSSLSTEERRTRREEATKNLMNIDMTERERRFQIGTIATYASAAYVVWAGLFADDGGIGGHLLRFLAIIPILIAVGYRTSAKEGICNIGQAGLWDIEGTGLKSIEDRDLATALLNKVNAMNVKIGLTVTIPVLLFALLPSHTSHALVFFTVAGAILYAVRDKIPENEF
ncbi:hypothetical protein MPSEU_000878900 [Mayamaea pseudoterrestris]|nr:hypothetical protein MPSEU_000878900 [Mayamaea pseudoterrestris]